MNISHLRINHTVENAQASSNSETWHE